MTDPTLTSLHIYPDDTLRDGQRVHYGGSDRFDVSRAEYERMRAMFAAAEPVTERNCYGCRFNRAWDYNSCQLLVEGGEPDHADVLAYVETNIGEDDMPTDRSIPCPGWSAKVTT